METSENEQSQSYDQVRFRVYSEAGEMFERFTASKASKYAARLERQEQKWLDVIPDVKSASLRFTLGQVDFEARKPRSGLEIGDGDVIILYDVMEVSSQSVSTDGNREIAARGEKENGMELSMAGIRRFLLWRQLRTALCDIVIGAGLGTIALVGVIWLLSWTAQHLNSMAVMLFVLTFVLIDVAIVSSIVLRRQDRRREAELHMGR